MCLMLVSFHLLPISRAQIRRVMLLRIIFKQHIHSILEVLQLLDHLIQGFLMTACHYLLMKESVPLNGILHFLPTSPHTQSPRLAGFLDLKQPVSPNHASVLISSVLKHSPSSTRTGLHFLIHVVGWVFPRNLMLTQMVEPDIIIGRTEVAKQMLRN